MLNAVGFKVSLCQDSSVRVEECADSHFYKTIHFHEEYQLTLILKGAGSLTVGSEIHRFKSGEFYLFGKNLPHGFRNDERYLYTSNDVKAHHISVFFNMDSYSDLLDQNEETEVVKALLAKSLFGLKLEHDNTVYLVDKMRKLSHLSDFDKVIELLSILDYISDVSSYKLLADDSNIKFLNSDNDNIDKINKVFQFINYNYKNKISLKSISNHFNMTSGTFARFFKLRTQKTFSQYLIETRILKACELIRNGFHNTTESCYDSGFTNISNFHRHFKKIIGMTPTQYKLNNSKK